MRTVMMWLLIAALPVQSWAVATMVNCGPTHHRMAGHRVAGAVEPSQFHAAHSAEAHSHSGHDHASHHHYMAADGHVHQGQADTDQHPLHGKFKCSACASCCLGVALPSPILTFDASVSSDAVVVGIPQERVVFLTASLERPPRTILA